MQIRRAYRRYADPEFPLIATRNHRAKVNPVFISVHWHSEIEFFYAAKGSFEVYDDTPFVVNTGDLCIFPPGKHHCIRNISDDAEFWDILFPTELINMPETHFFQKEFVTPLRTMGLTIPPVLHREQADPLVPAMETIINSKSRAERFVAVIQLCTQIMPYCTVLPNSSAISAEHTAIQKCIQYLNNHYTDRFSLAELADHVHLHPNYLCALFKKHTGETVSQYLTRSRVGQASELLRTTQMPISQVAEISGFANEDFFCKKFKAIRGMTPNAYHKTQGKLKND